MDNYVNTLLAMFILLLLFATEWLVFTSAAASKYERHLHTQKPYYYSQNQHRNLEEIQDHHKSNSYELISVNNNQMNTWDKYYHQSTDQEHNYGNRQSVLKLNQNNNNNQHYHRKKTSENHSKRPHRRYRQHHGNSKDDENISLWINDQQLKMLTGELKFPANFIYYNL